MRDTLKPATADHDRGSLRDDPGRADPLAIDIAHVGRIFDITTGAFRRSSKRVVAVDDLSLQIGRGELFGLLGPNGAGKTTTIKILTTLLLPTSGRATVLGLDVVRHAVELRHVIGFVFGGDRGLYSRLSGRENLRYFAALYGLSATMARQRVDEVLRLVGLATRGDERVEGFSRGMKQRLHLARVLLHDPEVLFLDEPTLGLDPVGARELRETIKELCEAGKTVTLTTHYMFEADELCDRVAIINNGRLVALGTPAELKATARDLQVLEVEALGVDSARLERLRALPSVDSVALERRELRHVVRLHSSGARPPTAEVLDVLHGLPVTEVRERSATLEDVYVRLVGRVE